MFIKVLLVLAILGLAVFAFDMYDSVHDVSLVSKDIATTNAKNYLANKGIDINGYDTAIVFTTDNYGYSLLQQKLGEDGFEDFLDEHKLAYYKYSVRFFKEHEIEEVFVILDAENGKVIGFNRYIEESESRPPLSQDEAKAKALDFLSLEGFDKEALEDEDYLSDSVFNRTDHFFTFKFKGTDLDTDFGSTHLSLSITVLGDGIEGYDEPFVFVPETFYRSIDTQFGLGDLLSILAILASTLVLLASLVVMIIGFVKASIKWKIFLYIAIGVFVLLVLNSINEYQSIKYYYPTELPFFAFLLSTLSLSLIGSLGNSITLFITGASGQFLSNEIWPRKLYSKNASKSILIGYMVGLFSLGLTSLIFLFGEKYLGVWYLADISNYNNLLTIIPIIPVLMISILPAISEEFTYRLFGITFLKKYLKSTCLAVILMTIIWAVAHSSSPVFPFYFRAIEVFIGGLIFAYFFVRYDLITVITAHFIFNALITIPIFLAYGNFLYTSTALLVAILPLILAVIPLFRKRLS